MNSHQKESWFRAVTRSAAQIRQRFGVPDQAMEARMVRVFRAALRPRVKAGRKPERATVHAAEMWTAGMEDSRRHTSLRLYQRLLWQKIYREVFPDFARMEAASEISSMMRKSLPKTEHGQPHLSESREVT